MNTVIEILCFLNGLDFTDQINNDHIEKLRYVKQRLAIEFEGYNISKLIHTLRIIDEMIVSIKTISLDPRLEKISSLLVFFLYLISFEPFVEK